MAILNIIITFIACFLGYIIGRLSDYYLNFWMKDPNWAPDHWIYGLLLIIAGILLFRASLGLWIFSFGAGLFISDLKDFLKLKFWGKDGKNKWQRKFWHID